MAVEARVNTRNLDALAAGLSDRQIDASLRRAGFDAESRAKQSAPIDTGFLRSSIRTEPGRGEVTVGASAEYAPYVEMGTRRMKAQPYLTPALQAAADSLIKALEHMFRRAQ